MSQPLWYRQLFVVLPYPTEDLTGQTIIVTGANSGLGFEAARHFVRLNVARVILGVRNVKAGQDAAAAIGESSIAPEFSAGLKGGYGFLAGPARTAKEPCQIEVWSLDMAQYSSVLAFGERMKSLDRVDAVVLNAGVLQRKFELAEKDELTLTVNVVSTMLLAVLSVPVLRASADKWSTRPRLSAVTSETHAWAVFKERDSEDIFAALDDEAKTNMRDRYFVSKLLAIMAMRALSKQLERSSESSKQLTLNLPNPGLCHSGLARNIGTGLPLVARVYMRLRSAVLARTTEQGSRTLFHGAIAGPETSGKYLSDCLADETYLSDFVKSSEGQRVQVKVWKELCAKIEAIKPGATQAL